MNKNQETNDKICSFYISDYHFEMISLPYINKKIEEKKEVIILTENNLENTINKLISNINLNQEKKEKILNLDWNNNDLNKFKLINDNIKNNRKMVVIIKGNEDYIKKINKNIENLTKDGMKMQVIDCYNIEDISEKMDEIVSNYTRMLSTKGEKILEK